PRCARRASTVARCADPLRQIATTRSSVLRQVAARTLVYRRRTLSCVLKDLGKRGITSVLIEGGGEVLGQALDSRFIDKVHIYLGPVLTGGPVLAFSGQGAKKTADALRLRDARYQQMGQTVCITGYPEVE